MTPLPTMLEWIASHPRRFARKGYKPPNHLVNGEVRWFGEGGMSTFAMKLDSQGRAPKEYTVDPPPTRVEVYGGDGALLYAEDAT